MIKQNDSENISSLVQSIEKRTIRTIKNKYRLYRFGFYMFLCVFLLLFVFKPSSIFLYIKKHIGTSEVTKEQLLEKQNKEILTYIKTLVQIPDEKPIITEITRKEIIESQPFFQHAEIGDILILFYQSKKAILYSPKNKKIVELANIKTADPDLPREMIGI